MQRDLAAVPQVGCQDGINSQQQWEDQGGTFVEEGGMHSALTCLDGLDGFIHIECAGSEAALGVILARPDGCDDGQPGITGFACQALRCFDQACAESAVLGGAGSDRPDCQRLPVDMHLTDDGGAFQIRGDLLRIDIFREG